MPDAASNMSPCSLSWWVTASRTGPKIRGVRRPVLECTSFWDAEFQGQHVNNKACIARGDGRVGAESARSLFGSTFFSFKNILGETLLPFPSSLQTAAAPHFFPFSLGKGQLTFSVKSQIPTILGSEGQMVSVETIRPCSCSTKSATEDAETNGCGCVPIKLYLQMQASACKLWFADPYPEF